MENGNPKYTDLILNNPDKLPITQVMAKYFIASWSGPIVQDKRYIEQYYTLPELDVCLCTPLCWASSFRSDKED
ncbi:hypothetical protein [Paenibacillus koleovorans]|uniref:hypothetical protein n=1 Tax=Paenibacillus koleovorans TaxID=121608 RepID=UPI000FD88266|nr:hypothetical protein [Paenibacillus koleovorans]